MTQEALKLALAALEINLTLLEKITPYKGQEDFLSDSIAITQDTITAIKEALAQRKPLTEEESRAKFEAWYSSAPDASEPERIYELTDESMTELTKECIWLGWQAAHGIKENT